MCLKEPSLLGEQSVPITHNVLYQHYHLQEFSKRDMELNKMQNKVEIKAFPKDGLTFLNIQDFSFTYFFFFLLSNLSFGVNLLAISRAVKIILAS